jgi:hypothetical protein
MVHPVIGDPYEVKTHYFPPTPTRILPAWLKQLKGNLRKLMPEIYEALNHNLRSLASTGIRTIVDQTIMDKVGDKGTFGDKLNALINTGIIDIDDAKLLDTIIEAGSASAHRAFVPTTKTLLHMIDIMESMLDQIYIAPQNRLALIKKAENVKKNTPRRR